MKTLKLGSVGEQVEELCRFLGITQRSKFDAEVQEKVIEFQKQRGLGADGIVGFNTWKEMYLYSATALAVLPTVGLTIQDYTFAAKLLDCETAALRAVMQIETGGRSGMTGMNPTVLFEGHVFWRELKAKGINPQTKVAGNEDILYPKWDKSKYKGGEAEWKRLEKARKINVDAANASASWGILQIMGNNYKACGCKSVGDFVKQMSYGSLYQLMLGVTFIKNNPILVDALRKKDWKTFARTYNGSGQVEAYSLKLKTAYAKLIKK